MAYKNDSKMGYKQGNMSPKVEDFAKPEACYAQKYDQAPLNYIERQNATQKRAASKMRGEAFQGRYNK